MSRADLIARLIGAIVVLPQGATFAMLAGIPPACGLYAAMVLRALVALFGSNPLMVTGSANAISLTTMALVALLVNAIRRVLLAQTHNRLADSRLLAPAALPT